jgi:pimeloyl-ACP methyl ester carboxylesterase
VLVHSALGDSRLWRRQTAALEPRFDVVAPDLPGFGESPMPAVPFSFVDAVAEHLPGALVGNSFGGRIALETALAHPDRVSKLVLVDAGLGAWDWTEEMRGYFAAENAAVEAGDLEGAIRTNLDFWVDPAFHDEVRPQQRRLLELQTAHEEPELRWPTEKLQLSELDVPTLVVVGERDKADFHAIAKHLAEQIPGAQLEVVPNAGHLVGVERPDALNELLLEFL